jgi:signal peptidase
MPRWLDIAVTALVVGAFAVVAVAVASGNYQIRPVLSGSMRPSLPVGGVVITQRVPVSDLGEGDVIVFLEPDSTTNLVVHRIVSLEPGSSGPIVHTKGDANEAPDPWTLALPGDHAYRAVSCLPFVGYLAVWAHSPSGGRVLVVIGTLLMLGAALGAIGYRRRSTLTAAGGRAAPRRVRAHGAVLRSS